MSRASFLAPVLALAVPLCVGSARAADPIDDARAEYDAGAAAYDRRDYALAAERFARADAHVPNARALELAMDAALRASDPALAMNLVERSDARPSARAARLARKLRARFAAAAGRIRFSCGEAARCSARVDGQPASTERPFWVAPGRHSVTLESESAAVEREVGIGAGESIDLSLDGASARIASSPQESTAIVTADATAAGVPRSGLSPVFFWTALSATAVAAAAATVLTVDVANRHDAFVANPSRDAAEAGDSAQTRARIVWGAAGALGITTIALALLTDFGREPASAAIRIDVAPGALLVAGRFR